MDGEGMECPGYTLGMMADVLEVPPAAVRHWVRRGFLVPTRRSGSLAWFDFEEMVVGRRLAGLVARGLSLREIERELASLGRGDAAAAARAAGRVVCDGSRLLLYCDGRVLGGSGQLHLPFYDEDARLDGPRHPEAAILPVGLAEPCPSPSPRAAGAMAADPPEVNELLDLAAELASEGHLIEACEALRAVLQSRSPSAEVAFVLAEMLYRAGDLPAARERFYMAIELDPDHLAARASLGCVLAEMEEHDLAIAALDGVVRQQPDFADAHWQLAGVLERTGRFEEARHHLREFITLAPESPWTDAALDKLACLS